MPWSPRRAFNSCALASLPRSLRPVLLLARHPPPARHSLHLPCCRATALAFRLFTTTLATRMPTTTAPSLTGGAKYRELYPIQAPFDTGYLDTGDGHEV